jgi:hypothetical protein
MATRANTAGRDAAKLTSAFCPTACSALTPSWPTRADVVVTAEYACIWVGLYSARPGPTQAWAGLGLGWSIFSRALGSDFLRSPTQPMVGPKGPSKSTLISSQIWWQVRYHALLGLGLSCHFVGLGLGLKFSARPKPKLGLGLGPKNPKTPGPLTSIQRSWRRRRQRWWRRKRRSSRRRWR